MIKRTLYFGNPGYMHLHDAQLVWEPEAKEGRAGSVPVEDIGLVLIDHYGITLSHGLMIALMDANAVVVHCNQRHMPSGFLIAYESNTRHSEIVKAQIETSVPLNKNLWQQLVKAKILNQADALAYTGQKAEKLVELGAMVSSGDPQNIEGQAAAYYFAKFFGPDSRFKRKRDGEPPNHLLNYGYAILRAIVARSLVGSGLLGVLGIHHRNKYNAWCLADDMMEPFRPFVDKLVLEVWQGLDEVPEELTPELKKKLLVIPTLDTLINEERSPLMVASNRSTASLVKVYLGETRKLALPSFSQIIA
jgi:CRISPR-associated protein Cas1